MTTGGRALVTRPEFQASKALLAESLDFGGKNGYFQSAAR
jgi:hypothetical protein